VHNVEAVKILTIDGEELILSRKDKGLGLLALMNGSEGLLGVIVEIEDGKSTQEIAQDLKNNDVIKSKLLFEVIVRIFRGDKGIMSGDYFFEENKNLFSVAYRMMRGVFGLTPVKVTVLEGMTVKEMSEVFAKKFSEFDPNVFIEKGKDLLNLLP